MLAALALVSAVAVTVCYLNGWLLYYGDAEAHLNIARRMVDSRTPGYDQVGTVWLPLPHLLMLPLRARGRPVGERTRRRHSLRLRLPPRRHVPLLAACRIFDCPSAAFAAAALFALNPNVLYLQSIPMTEIVFSACLLALLYFTVRFRDTQGGAPSSAPGSPPAPPP